MKKSIIQKCLSISIIIGLSACATVIPVDREAGNLNFDYKVKSSVAPTRKSIAIVSPQFVTSEQNGMAVSTTRFSAQYSYQHVYSQRLATAMMNSMQEIVASKGFTTKGPYESFDDIPFGDKKSLYLAAVPSLKVYFDQRPQQLSRRGMVCREQGTFTATGELVYKMVEPLTGQALMTKRINLSDFSISKEYVREFQTRSTSNGLLGAAIDKAMNPEKLEDNTDSVMSEALNEFFAKTMSKIDSMISTEELMSFDGDVQNLKNLKRF